MSNDRVVSRLYARLLTEEEMTKVRGAIIGTGKCTLDPRTCAQDGDCSPEPNC